MSLIPNPYVASAKVVGYILAAAALAWLLWWLVGQPRADLAAQRAAHQKTKAEHAAVLEEIARGSAVVAALAARSRTDYEAHKTAAAETYRKGVEDAYERGVATAGDIAAGTVSVREVWRDSCAFAAPGDRAELGGGAAGVNADRAAGIGRILGITGEGDAAYDQCYARLKAAQLIVNACYEKPAPGTAH